MISCMQQSKTTCENREKGNRVRVGGGMGKVGCNTGLCGWIEDAECNKERME